ncbi:unnamed protein product [Prunus armeniaca]|uniref:Reverse transcriptase domain-containing protein n=1 Tax=Prunus armeniaca TaxID=36596 RepID=A0A6J5TKH0_PRUAR|nr:unnamed protein product [Prunus armeniaca]
MLKLDMTKAYDQVVLPQPLTHCYSKGALMLKDFILFYSKLNDSLQFYDVEPHQVTELKRIFHIYKEASDQQVNLEKLALYFSPSTPSATQA